MHFSKPFLGFVDYNIEMLISCFQATPHDLSYFKGVALMERHLTMKDVSLFRRVGGKLVYQ